MSIDLPQGLKATFNRDIEQVIFEKMGQWLDKHPRSPGLHASDLLDPRKSYWSRENPLPRTREATDHFFLGKTGEAMVVSMLEGLVDEQGKPMINPYAGGKQQTSKEFGIEYAPDWEIQGVPLEIKMTRKWQVDTTLEDIRYYVEQCLIYMAIMGITKYYLLIYYLCAEEKPSKKKLSYFVLVEISFPESELAALAEQVKAKIYHTQKCFDEHVPSKLPVCRPWKCGQNMCEQWEACQPEGRYGKLYRDWEEAQPVEMFEP